MIFDEPLDIPICDGSILCECPECANAREEMIRWGHFVPTKKWEKTKSTGEELEVCDFCETPVLGATVCDSCKLLHKKLDSFYTLLEAAILALDNLPFIATHETINSVVYHKTRMKLLLAIEKFEND